MIPLVDLKAQYLGLKEEIDSAIQNVLDNSSFIMGVPVKKFEENLARFCNCKYAVGVSSGSSALFLALKAYSIKEGDEIITVSNSFISTAESIVQCGARPVFVDVDEKTMLINPSKIEEKITPKTKAIIPVHLYGQISDMDPIIEIAKKHNLIILEDAAQAIDSEYKDRKLPVYETAIFSFFPAKNLGCYGDGGAVITNDDKIADVVSKLRDHGRISKYESGSIGYGERLDGMQAAILDVKLNHLRDWSEKRRQNAYRYNEAFKDLKGISVPFEEEHSKHVYYVYTIKTDKRDELAAFLKEKGIATGVYYPVPLHLQPSMKFLGYKEGDFPITEEAAKKIISLPLCPNKTGEEIRLVCEKVKEFLLS